MLFDILTNLFQNFLFYALHLTQSGSFPKPLPAKEEQAYLLRVKHGDTKAADLLIEHNLRLVAHIIKKYYSNYKDQEDLISIGTIGLIKAVSTFDCEKGARFATYASKCIENVILTQRLYSISNTEIVSPLIYSGRSGHRKTTTCFSSTARSLALSHMRRSTFCGFLSIR